MQISVKSLSKGQFRALYLFIRDRLWGGALFLSAAMSRCSLLRCLFIAVAFCCLFNSVHASLGDRLPEFRECVEVKTERINEYRKFDVLIPLDV